MKAFGKEGDLCVNLFMARDDDDDDDDMYRGNVLIRFYGPSTVKQDEEIERKSKAPDFFFFGKTVHLHFLRNLADMSLSARKDKKEKKRKRVVEGGGVLTT